MCAGNLTAPATISLRKSPAKKGRPLHTLENAYSLQKIQFTNRAFDAIFMRFSAIRTLGHTCLECLVHTLTVNLKYPHTLLIVRLWIYGGIADYSRKFRKAGPKFTVVIKRMFATDNTDPSHLHFTFFWLVVSFILSLASSARCA